jgi:hypothetical protein
MKRRPTTLFAIVFSVLAASAALVSCKQEEGERCQVSSDCADGLICGSAGGGSSTLTCRENTPTVFIDAMPIGPGGAEWGSMTQPDVRRYLVSGHPDGPVLTLRGHEMFVPRLLLIIGAICLAGCVAGVYGVITSPGDEIPIGIAIAGAGLGIGLVGYALRRLRHPQRAIIIDKTKQTMTVVGGATPATIPFAELGPMAIGAMTVGMRAQRLRYAVIGLSRHPGLVLYEPFGEHDITVFAVTLRHIIGEEFLPRAKPKA